ncbi:3-oxoacyl-ACP reductase FabG [Olivibacter sp. SDN3]|uniref:SDR family NAD(P)-dependent oxidoreductase n=1 Tax=Olivibacter sp. SDN3 TaxID=2764720 RepID=UPI001650EFD4|nr:3-oxoacyl-ACP reductase family protein [Olivibacter sp. SDN3]QNL49321.1 3-oxoacyl-ACP reductase FabG [Olivibacter sp. SDN3]
MEKLKGKIAFITGGSRGMGAAIAKRLSKAEATVVFTHSGRNPEQAAYVLEQIKESGKNEGLSLVADNNDTQSLIDALKTTIDRYGTVDILINNAGVYIDKPIVTYSLKDFEEVMNVNVKAVFVASQYVARYMKRGGRIITIGSNMAERLAFPGGSLYSMSKAALVGLTKGLARDLGSADITVNLVQPGPVNTDMNPEDGAFATTIKEMMAIGRYGTVDEIAGLVSYLVSDEARFVTGTSITIDGGFNI